MMPPKNVKSVIKKIFGIGYLYLGYDRLTYEVEVNDKNGVEIADFTRNKLVEVPRKTLFGKLSVQDKNIIKTIFLKNDIPSFNVGISVLLLTQPLFADGFVSDENAQISVYQNMTADHLSGGQLVIKPHPRDETDYSKVFPDAIFLDRNMPIEILRVCLCCSFKKAVAFGSTALEFINADETINVKLSEYI